MLKKRISSRSFAFCIVMRYFCSSLALTMHCIRLGCVGFFRRHVSEPYILLRCGASHCRRLCVYGYYFLRASQRYFYVWCCSTLARFSHCCIPSRVLGCASKWMHLVSATNLACVFYCQGCYRGCNIFLQRSWAFLATISNRLMISWCCSYCLSPRVKGLFSSTLLTLKGSVLQSYEGC